MSIDIYAPQAARPHIFKTHVPLNEVPKEGKCIVVLRHPHDTILSHYKFFEDFFFEKETISIETFAREYFIPRKSILNHILAFWDRRMDKNVLPLCFENMKTVECVAEFIGVTLDDELKKIVLQQSDIKFMQKHIDKFDDHVLRKIRQHAWKFPFSENAAKVRKGQVGESKRAAPDEIKHELDKLWQEEITAKIGQKSYDDLRKHLAK